MGAVFDQAIATPGIFWLAGVLLIAGLVRGFSGFGSALIFVPVAGFYLPPAQVIGIITLMGIPSAMALLPTAWGPSDKSQVSILAGMSMVFVPIGIYLMVQLDGETVRWIVAAVATVTLIALISGWRYSRELEAPGLAAVGSAAGIVGGMTGMAGPVVILFYLAGTRGVEMVRANTILFMAATDLIVAVNLVFRGLVGAQTLVLAMVLSVPYITTTLIGQALFKPHFAKAYRVLAYSVIGVAIVVGLPIWG